MVRIIFTGAQGTGKTTILNHFQEQGVPVVTEVVRNLSKQGIKINEQGTEEGQKTIFNEYMRLLSQDTEYISDRGLTDVLGYSLDLYAHGQVSHEEVQREIDELAGFLRTNPDVVYMYFPIEFDVVDDGVRSVDEDYRKRIDQNIHDILCKGIPYVEVRGTVEERIKIVQDVILLHSQQRS